MFKMFPQKFLIAAVAWLTILVLAAADALRPLMTGAGLSVGKGMIVAAVQLLFTLLLLNPVWRFIWRKVPKLNELVYPDLNGEWDVEVCSNWPRIQAVMAAAAGTAPAIDVAKATENDLPPLGSYKMRASITQSWLKMKMTLWNPAGHGPIKESKTLMVEPFRGEEGRHGLAYVFEQENETDDPTDDRTFRGAAWLVLDRGSKDVLCGRMWSDRTWRRGINTAANLRFVRAPAASN
jgi:hypothetical protein